jgi:hypothetical protein
MARFDSEQPYTEQLDPDYGIPRPPADTNPELTAALARFRAARDELRDLVERD